MSQEKAGGGRRQERLAAALRDNLRRRKAAHRPQSGDGQGEASGEAGPKTPKIPAADSKD